MAKLIIITHEYDLFAFRTHQHHEVKSPYLLFDLLREIESIGHSWQVAKGPNPASGDVALLHVDSTVVERSYLDLRSHYSRTINFSTVDISKRQVSKLILSKNDSWDGRVIVKCDLNNGGIMEDIHNRAASRLGRPLPHPGVTRSTEYCVLESLSDVDDRIWEDESLVVERFLPESEKDGGYVLRTWVFMGHRERCTKMITPGWISKAGDVIRYEPIEVPAQLRAERERLGFDFGKFDFVMHEGQPILLDANRTPGVAQAIRPMMKAGARNLAEGLNSFLTS
jgi:hypothetical protein